ncbi:MAG: DedA family protein [Rhodospirillales bacterium]|nr:DedA family protein [Rhodospirillales bacterium]MDH3918302.1 DedA family protein [Rhodospirillales bacterium]
MTGYLGLFASAFLAATLLPMSSEAVLAALTAASGHEALVLWLAASTGNTLGALVNWALGRFCLHWRERRWFPVKPDQLARAGAWFRRYGLWSLLFAWLPVVGDPLTFVGGILRVNVWLFLLLVGAGKAARYAAVILAVQGVLGAR